MTTQSERSAPLNDSVLNISNLVFSYDQTPFLEVSQFEVTAGENVAVLGPSGCGKTTFMHLITGLLRPQSGSIVIGGTEITTLSESEIDRVRGQHMGIVFQRLHLLPTISVLDNLLLAQRLARATIDREYALSLLKQLDIEELAGKPPTRLSQGQAQRVAIARSVAHRPRLLVADEPTSALDDTNAQEAMKLLGELTSTTGAALVIVTHDHRVRDQMDRVFDMAALS